MSNRASILKQQFLQSVALPWKELLPDFKVQELLANENVRYYSSVYTPIVTLWAMVSQVLSPDKSQASSGEAYGYLAECSRSQSSLFGHRGLQ